MYYTTQFFTCFKESHIHITRIQTRAPKAELGAFLALRQTGGGTLWSEVLVCT